MKISKIVSNSEMISNFGLSRENEAFSLVPDKSSDELTADKDQFERILRYRLSRFLTSAGKISSKGLFHT